MTGTNRQSLASAALLLVASARMDDRGGEMHRSGVGAALSIAVVVAACGGKHQARPAPGPAEFAELDDLATPAEEPAPTTLATGPTLVAGHADARYELAIPPGLTRLRGVLAGDHDPRELSAAGPDGVGLRADTEVWLDVIVVFSDPMGLGPDMGAIAPADRDTLVAMYGEGIRERFPSATAPRLVSIGAHTAARIELPRVEMPDRPVRSGRHYLVLDGGVTVSVDCMWTETNAERMAAACDAVAASLRRATAGRR